MDESEVPDAAEAPEEAVSHPQRSLLLRAALLGATLRLYLDRALNLRRLALLSTLVLIGHVYFPPR